MIPTLPTGNVENYTLVLARPDHTHIGILRYYDEFHCTINLTGADELSFNAYKPSQDELDSLTKEEREQVLFLWDELVDFKYVFVKELNEYFEIEVEVEDSEILTKSVTGTDASATELGNVRLFNYEINTDDDIDRDDYTIPSILYRPDNPDASILHRMISKVPQWSIANVDPSLRNIQREFSFNDVDLWEALSDIAEEIECLFQFDSVNRMISVYDLLTVCADCGYRGDYDEVCPKCGSTDVAAFGDETTILIDVENLAEDINYTTDTKSVKNCFKLEAGDEDMTAMIRNINPNGSDYLYYFTDAMKHEMPNELVQKIEAYDALMESERVGYEKLTQDIYDSIDKIIHYQSGMMPKVDFTNETAEDELKKLTSTTFDEIALSEIKRATSLPTVNTAIKSYVRLLINSGRYKVDVEDASWTMNEDFTAGVWKGKIKLCSFSTWTEKDEEDRDEALSKEFTVQVTTSFDKFIEQKIKAHIKDHDDEDGSVYDVLNIEDLQKFRDALPYYCLNRLISFADALTGVRDIMIEAGQAVTDAELYDSHYIPILDKIAAVQEQISHVANTISVYEKKLAADEEKRNKIQTKLNFVKFLGEDLYKTFCIYKKEQSFTNKNFISDDLEDNELFENAKQFYETANRELKKSAENQHSIKSTVHNLLAMPEFAPLKDGFRLGNFIRERIDGKVYKLRLTSIGLKQGSQENIDVEFSDVLRTGSGFSDVKSILDSAKKVAGSYDATVHQVKKSKEQADFVKDFVDYGMSATAVKVVNNATRQSLVVDDSGLLMRQKVDYTADEYEPYQSKMIGSGLYTTTDNWRTVSTALGKYITMDPETGKQMVAYGLLADTIVGRLILGNKLGIYSSDASSEMSFDNDGLILNAKDNGSGVYKNIFSIRKDGENLIWVDNQGNLMLKSGQIDNLATNFDTLNAQFAQIDNLYVHNATLEKIFAGDAVLEDSQIFNLSSQNVKLKDATIARAIIQQLNAGMVDAAFINTDFIKIGNTNENFLINGSTLQIVDENDKVRVQIGKDAETGKYSYWLWNEDGDLIWNPEGITAAGVPEKLIVNDMVSDTAGIKAWKLDIPSLVQTLNEDGSITTDIRNITIDGEGFEALFQQLVSKVDEHEDTMKDHGVQITANKEAIEKKIWLNDMSEVVDPINGQVSTIHDQYTQVTQDLDGIRQSIKDVESTVTENEKTSTTRFNKIEDTVDGHTQKIEELSQTVSDNQTDMTTKYNDVVDTLDGHTRTIASLNTNIQNVEQSITQHGTSIQTLTSTVATHTETLEGFTNKLESVEKTTTEKINDVEKALSGKADGTAVTDLTERVSAIEQTQDSITLSVSKVEETVKKTIKDVKYYYILTSNPNTVPEKDDAGWQDQPMECDDDHYIWQMCSVTYQDDTVEKKTPFCLSEKAKGIPLVRIESDKGITFRNNKGQTLLSCVVLHGSKTYRTIAEVRAAFGSNAYIEWEEKTTPSGSFTVIPALDTRIQAGGMQLLVKASEVDDSYVVNCYINDGKE